MFSVDQTQLTRTVVRDSYYEFVKEFWNVIIPEKPVWNWHIELMCDEIQKVMERVFVGEPKRYDLIFNIAPGSSKSSVCSVFLLPWCWTWMPQLRSLNGSHTHELVLDLSRKSREVVTSEQYRNLFPNVLLNPVQNTKGHFANTRGGGRMSCTVAGKSPMGFHAHVHVVDDPIDPRKAISDIEIDKANTWLIETLSTRKVEKSVTPLILVMQRLAQNDPTGYMSNRGVGKIKHFVIPAELTPDVKPPELRQLYKDGLMDPIRISRAVLEEEKEKGDYFYSSQFLQNPIPLGGGMFLTQKLVKETSAPPDHMFREIVRCWDNAGSPTGNKKVDRRRAHTVGLKMGIHKDGTFWILDVIRGRYKTHHRETLKKITAQLDGLHVEIMQEQEGGSGGQESAEYTVRNLAGYRIKTEQPKGDKVLRADAFSAQVNKGNVHFVEASWNKEYIEEMKHFPYSTYKDQIDASSAAFQRLFQKKRRVGALFRRKTA